MASNPASPFGKKLGQIENLQGRLGSGALGQPLRAQANEIPTVEEARAQASENAFAALTNRQGRPLRIAILSDFTRIPYANGAAFQTRFLYQELRRCGHEVTVIGPRDPDAKPEELAPGTVNLPSLPLKTYPGVHLPM